MHAIPIANVYDDVKQLWSQTGVGYTPTLVVAFGGLDGEHYFYATTEVWNDRNNQKQEKTEWHRVILWGKQAESLQEYLTKGKQIYIEGRLQTRQWDDKDGNKRYTTEVRGDRVVLLGGGGGGAGRQQQRTAGPAGMEEPMGEPATELTDDDIPF